MILSISSDKLKLKNCKKYICLDEIKKKIEQANWNGESIYLGHSISYIILLKVFNKKNKLHFKSLEFYFWKRKNIYFYTLINIPY